MRPCDKPSIQFDVCFPWDSFDNPVLQNVVLPQNCTWKEKPSGAWVGILAQAPMMVSKSKAWYCFESLLPILLNVHSEQVSYKIHSAKHPKSTPDRDFDPRASFDDSKRLIQRALRG